MDKYLLQRIVQAVICLLGVTAIIFMLVRLTGDPIEAMLPEMATKEDYDRLAAYWGMDKPVFVQYGVYLGKMVRGDFGTSTRSHRPVIQEVLKRFPATIELTIFAAMISVLVAVPIGAYSALRRRGWLDMFGRVFAIIGQSMPTFWLGILLILMFSGWLGLLPSSGRGSVGSYVLPAITLGYYLAAGIMRITRSAFLEVLDSEYIKFARVKGLSEPVVLWKHAFKNAALPVLTFSVTLFINMLSGSVVTEAVFGWPGVGLLMIESIRYKDFPVVQAVVVLLSALYLIGNLVTDIAYGYLNPKIRY